MRLASVTAAARPVLIEDGRMLPLDRAFGYSSLSELVAAGPAALEELRRRAGEEDGWLEDVGERQAPLPRPGKIVCVGLNYRDHARESGAELPSSPLLFAKYANTVVGPDAGVAWDPALTSQVDWEAELAVVVGAPLRGAGEEEAREAIFGYTAANDLSARDLQFGDGQWTRGKSLDGFCPLGPEIVTADEVADPQALAVRSRVNGETMQDSSTAEMVFGVVEILSFVSQGISLEPGDLVLTGTPWGVGAFREPPIFLAAGDVVEVEVEGIGVLRTPIVAPADRGAGG